MSLLPLSKLGACETAPGVLSFGLYLPGVTAAIGAKISVKVIHEKDQFMQAVPPFSFVLANTADPDFPNGDYWTAQATTKAAPPGTTVPAGARWGQKGRYLYRYVVSTPGAGEIDFVVDPYAREYGVGDLSAITVGYQDHKWSSGEAGWRVPALQDLIAYELQIDEFGGSVEGTIDLLDYLRDLGINCIELMPVNNVKNSVNWGYDPFGYFGVDDRFGKRANLQRFIDEAHQRGIAVILDVVYGHTTGDFTFPYLYPKLGIANPFNGATIRDNGYGPVPDFNQPFVLDYFYTTNQIWLDKFHVDGFRYDNVPAFWDKDRPKAQYGALVQATHQLVQSSMGSGTGATVNYWNRFSSAGGTHHLIQCAEYLDDPPAVLNNTYTNCTWQDWTLAAAKDCAEAKAGAIEELGLRIGLEFFPEVQNVEGVSVPKTAFQYIENHDHSRFICEFGVDEREELLLRRGREENWYRLQPYLIGLLTAKGIPMLWEGGEFLQTFFVPDSGNGRQLVFRPVDFSNFYSDAGKALLSLTRRLIRIRNEGPQFRRGQHFFYDVDFYKDRGLLLFSRSEGSKFSLVALNFTHDDQQTTIELPISGNYVEQLDKTNNLMAVAAGATTTVKIPSNYGQIWTIG